MAIETVTCRVAKCDDCGDGWQDSDEYGTPHHPIEEGKPDAFLADLLKGEDDSGWDWTYVGGVLRCKTCSEKRECALLGHVWREWWTCRCGGRIKHPEGMTSEQRSCERCGAYDRRDAAGECEVLPEPVELSRAAQLVQWRRNHDLHVAGGHTAPGLIGDEDLAADVRAAIGQAVDLVAWVDAKLTEATS